MFICRGLASEKAVGHCRGTFPRCQQTGPAAGTSVCSRLRGTPFTVSLAGNQLIHKGLK